MSKEDLSQCSTCRVQLTLKHLVECRQSEEIRIKYKVSEFPHQYFRQNETATKQILKVLKEIGK